jgi:hypothetical protein
MRLEAGAAPLLIVAAVVIAMALPFLSQPWNIDEPVFVATAKHALQDPLHPLSFEFNWYGRAASMKEINNNPPVATYLFAAAVKASGGSEGFTRFLLLILDLVAALSLYGLAALYLRRPLWPTLAVVVSPAYALNMAHVMAEKPLAALAFPALLAHARGIQAKDDRLYWASAALFSLALMTKYAAAFLLLPAVVVALAQGVPARKVIAHGILSCLPLALYLLLSGGGQGREGLGAVAHVFSEISRAAYASPLNRSRASLAFIGGCGLVPALWSFLTMRARPWKVLVPGILIAILFLPTWDPLKLSWAARVTGVVFSCAALCALDGPLTSRRALWLAWAGSGVLLTFCYWSIVTRTVLFLLPPLTFAAAEKLEGGWNKRWLDKLYVLSTIAAAALTLTLAAVDRGYAVAQKNAAEYVVRTYASAGRTIWCGSHWGLQHYLVEGGARQLDWTRGGWDAARPGDVVVLSRVNSNVIFPERNVSARIEKIEAGSGIPLRLISGWGGQAGFYSNMNGFLPFAWSREPLDEFLVAEIQ